MITIHGNNNAIIYKGNAVVTYKGRLMGEQTLTVSIVSKNVIPFAFGCYADTEIERFYLYQVPTQTINEAYIEYTLIMESAKYELIRAEMLNFGASEYSLTTTMQDWLQLLCENVNRVVGGGWSYQINDANEEYKTLEITGENTLAALNRINSDFGKEFYVQGKIIYVGKRGVTHSLTLSVGRWKGLYNLTLEGISNQNPITRLYLYGSEKNLPSNYQNADGKPITKRLVVDAVNNGKRYIDSPNISKFGVNEGRKFFDDVWPRRTGTVTAVIDNLTFTDSSIDFDINAQLISGTSCKLQIKTGDLAGYDFELVSYNNATKAIRIKSITDSTGLAIPNDNVKIKAGDKYVLFDLLMPQRYITNEENNLKAKGVDWLVNQKNDDYQVKYTANALDLVFCRENGFTPLEGDYVPIKDDRLGIDRLIRIVEVNIDLSGPYKDYKSIELSDNIEPTLAQQFVQDNINRDTVIKTNDKRRKDDIRRGWSAMDELRENIFDQSGYFDTTKIKPASVDTGMLTVGAKESRMTLNGVTILANYLAVANDLRVIGGTLFHFSIPDTTGREWIVSSGVTSLADNNYRHIYARCSKGDNTASIVFDTQQLPIDADGYYYFLLGGLSSVLDGVRSIDLTYGQGSLVGEQLNIGKVNDPQGREFLNINERKVVGVVTFEGGSSGLESLAEWSTKQTQINNAQKTADAAYVNLLPWEPLWKEGLQTTYYGDSGILNNNVSDNYVVSALNPFGAMSLCWKVIIKSNNSFKQGVQSRKNINLDTSFSCYAFFKASQNTKVRFRPIVLPNGIYDVNGGFSVENYEFISPSEDWYLFYLVTHKVDYSNGETGLSGVYNMSGVKVKAAKDGKCTYIDKTDSISISMMIVSGIAGGNATFYNPTFCRFDDAVRIEDLLRYPTMQSAKDAAIAAAAAQSSADSANSSVSSLNSYVDGAFKDGVVDTSEAQAIDKLNKQVNTDFDKAMNDYNVVFVNPYLSGTPKTDLLNAKVSLSGAKDALQTSINIAIADGKTNPSEKADVDSKFNTYKNSFTDYQAKLSNASKAIQDTLKGYSDTAQITANNAIAVANAAQTAASNAQGSANSVSNSVASLNSYIDGAFKDNLISQSESSAIEQQKNVVNAQWNDFEKSFLQIYSNSYLEGTAKSDLLSAKNSLSASKDNLLSSIAAAIADGKTTSAEKSDVDSKYSLYINAIATYKTAVETANKAIQDKIKSYADTAQNTANSANNTASQASATAALANAKTKGFTEIAGGVVNTLLMMLGDGGVAGISGVRTDSNGKILPSRWAGGTYADAIAGLATIVEWFDGNVKYGDLFIDSGGTVKIKDAATGVVRLIMTKNNISTLASLGVAQDINVNNASNMYDGPSNTVVMLQNLLTVSNNNSEITINAVITTEVTISNVLESWADCQLIVYLNNVNSNTDVFIAETSVSVSDLSNPVYLKDSKPIANPVTVAAGMYRIKLVYIHDNNNAYVKSSISESSARIVYDSTIQHSEIGKNGIGIIVNASNYSVKTYEDGVFKVVEKTTGVYDVPGVIAAGSVASSGAHSNRYGPMVALGNQIITKGGTGIYIVPHNVKRSGFACIPVSTTDNVNVRCTAKSTNTFTVTCRNQSGTLVDASFDYQIVGNNN